MYYSDRRRLPRKPCVARAPNCCESRTDEKGLVFLEITIATKLEPWRRSDAQHVIAREYGFASWPRLVKYFEELERHRRGPRHNSSDIAPESLEGAVRYVLRRHARGEPFVARELAHFVPRFYGRSASD